MSSGPINYHVLDESDRDAVYGWWRQLGGEVDSEDVASSGPNLRAQKAVLRRARSPEDALLTDGFRRLWFALPESRRKWWLMPAWGCVAAVLAEVRRHDPQREFAASMGSEMEPGAGKPKVSELRFQQLQHSHDADEFLRRVRRAVHLLRNEVHVVSLADGILQWHQEKVGHPDYRPERRLPVRWANAYFTELAKYQKVAN